MYDYTAPYVDRGCDREDSASVADKVVRLACDRTVTDILVRESIQRQPKARAISRPTMTRTETAENEGGSNIVVAIGFGRVLRGRDRGYSRGYNCAPGDHCRLIAGACDVHHEAKAGDRERFPDIVRHQREEATYHPVAERLLRVDGRMLCAT